MRIAILTYSVKPRGGVVHALHVAEALAARGHAAELFAIGPPGTRFFRAAAVPAHVVPHVPLDGPFDARIAAMIEAYADGLRDRLAGFDVVHAQDCISANAALALRDEGSIGAVLRTVHHVDDFRSPSLIACQERSIMAPDRLLCVSPAWVRRLRDEFGVHAGLVRNGVDTRRYRPARDAAERAAERAALGFTGRYVVLAVGGIEPRKGSLTLLDAVARLPAEALLVIAGGATLFDYRDELERFALRRTALGLDDRRVRILGQVEDAELERLYRAADVLAFPSVMEGFGLVVLEAMASGLPVVASDLDVVREFAGECALLVPPGDSRRLGHLLGRLAADDRSAARLRRDGPAVAAGWSWDAAALAHERAYERFLALAAR
jgi:glycosyltransferase-like protein